MRIAFSLLMAGVLAAAAGCQIPPEPDLAARIAGARIVDLTHPFDEHTLYWPTDTRGFRLEQLAHGYNEDGWFYSAHAFCTAEHGGTHLDAPVHFHELGHTADALALERLIGAAVVIDVSAQATGDPDYRLTVADIERHELHHGRIPDGAIVLLRTGWSARWPDVRAYLGDDTPGDASNLSFPGYGEEAALLLMQARGVPLLGIDTASIDFGRSTGFEVHRQAAARQVAALENLTNLDALPPTGAVVIALPMKIAGGSGGPVRVVALLTP
jgi:kynurenine formamidase